MNQLTVQSTKNLITIVIAFLIGAINTLILYPYFFGAEKQGLVVFLLSTSNLLMPLIGLGISQTIIKFYSSYPENQKQSFLSFVVIIPLIIIIPLSLLSIIFHDQILCLLELLYHLKDYLYDLQEKLLTKIQHTVYLSFLEHALLLYVNEYNIHNYQQQIQQHK